MSSSSGSVAAWLESLGLRKISPTKAGAKSACPFHDDTGQSMSFFGEHFKCFSTRCGIGGTVDQFAEMLGQKVPDWVRTGLLAEAWKAPPSLPEIPRYRLAAYAVPYDRMRARGIPDAETDAWEIRWDHRRGGLLIPIADHEDRLVGCAWRYDNAKMRYQLMKGLPREHTLYGLGRYLKGEPEGLKHVYVVEGYADAWKCWVAGIPAVSSFGNRMTRGQVELLSRLGIYRVTVMYDNDKAGYDGAWACKKVGDKVLDLDFAMEYGLDGPKDPGDASVEFLRELAQNRKDRP